ncbi:antitoxin [Streptomyces sp. 549]|uniref:antitoxin n=1 Tax=Streptomyces sp. 549 TaxID=3049076 RepID=UPI0024C2BE29|nr:antitoxin [Streptomyces sp. 549]MDK1476440.1 antitoxin [Streptomyces sp. 549]
MSFLKKAKDLLAKHDDKVGQAVDRAAAMADSKTGGKYRDHIRTGSEKAKEAVEKLADDPKGASGTKGGAKGDESTRGDGGAAAERTPDSGTPEGSRHEDGGPSGTQK